MARAPRTAVQGQGFVLPQARAMRTLGAAQQIATIKLPTLSKSLGWGFNSKLASSPRSIARYRVAGSATLLCVAD